MSTLAVGFLLKVPPHPRPAPRDPPFPGGAGRCPSRPGPRPACRRVGARAPLSRLLKVDAWGLERRNIGTGLTDRSVGMRRTVGGVHGGLFEPPAAEVDRGAEF